jgi:hypothetical protein
MIEQEQCEFFLKLAKEEIAWQANTFDQIDNKTGVALGFTFVAVGQVLAAVFRMATDQNHFQSLHPYWITGLFISANTWVFLAIVCGICSRWPRNFQHSLTWDNDDYACEHIEILNSAFEKSKDIAKQNDEVLEEKGKWAKQTYRFVGLALISYLVLTVLLYCFSVPRH